ncbi:tetratricopeptide repeat protein [Streptomyces sp. NPDC012888]|uniref:tetratricopeptide repeat protein n=1 Tax=Streptomyces sp. NPDC012888 TaxID=3364855 RepID=UPI00368E2EF7
MTVGGDARYSALGPYSSVIVHQPPAQGEAAVRWPLEVGSAPALASAFQPRTALREQIDATRTGSGTAVLTHVLTGGGGVGKSQLAASYAAQALAEGTDLVVWAPATEPQQVVACYAQAALRVGAPGVRGDDPEADADAFLAWLATTSRRWLVVLDDVTDPAGIKPLWPASRTGSGRVLATTRLHDARLTGGGRRRIAVDAYDPAEASAYLRARLAEEAGLADGAVEELAQRLGRLPLALGHAAAYMINHGLPCTTYLARFTAARSLAEVLPPDADAEGYGRAVATTLLLSLDAAQDADPAGLAVPVLRLAAFLDPAGHPGALWATPAVRAYLGGAEPATVHTTLRVLHRYALLTCGANWARVHALTARAVRETIPDGELRGIAVVAAEALFEVWPHPEEPHGEWAAVLRANTGVLAATAGRHLWLPKAHPVLYRAGSSLANAGHREAALDYWEWMAAEAGQTFGGEHDDTLAARGNLALAYGVVGRTQEACRLGGQTLRDLERLHGPEGRYVVMTRAQMLVILASAGRVHDAIEMGQRALTGRIQEFGHEHPMTLSVLTNLIGACMQAGAAEEVTALAEEHLANIAGLLGPMHPYTLFARNNVAYAYGRTGRLDEAAALLEALVADAEHVLGPDHPDTRGYRQSLAYARDESSP